MCQKINYILFGIKKQNCIQIMIHHFKHPFNLGQFTVLMFSACLLLQHCRRSGHIDYSDALKQCAEKNSAKEQSFFIPGPECVVGAVFPKFECTTIGDKKIDQAYFKGKISIVNFWFEGCAPCVAEVPGFNNLVKKYGKDKLRYLSISLDPQEDVEAFLQLHDWEFDHVCNGNFIAKDIFHLPWGFPTTFLVDPNGIIIKTIIGGRQDSTAVTLIQEALSPSIERLLKHY